MVPRVNIILSHINIIRTLQATPQQAAALLCPPCILVTIVRATLSVTVEISKNSTMAVVIYRIELLPNLLHVKELQLHAAIVDDEK